MVLKYTSVISLIFIAAYALYPFINGVGCDFRSRVEDNAGSFYTTCKLGFVTTIARNKASNEVIKYHGIYGKTGNTILFLAYDISWLENGIDKEQSLVSKLHNSPLYVSKVIVEEGHDWVIVGFPYSRIHKTKRIGSLGFW
ncbi:hypothetical protein R2B70_14045 [Aeromonas sp. XH]|uniref:hypothetical protein n=1 Tax=Aeromonas sp. XH TaxID=3081770 RepID=UPI0029663F1F|nr:hypothetical protein [Aeromonas sp. XH]WOX47327.1 hypothetical protein R2B70_14045 [Aeromonas sp. XH]